MSRPLGLALAAALTGGAATMMVELAAGRILAPQLGVSLHTWSALIGFVLAGLSVGGWIGGVLADRLAPRTVLAGGLTLAAVAAAVLPPLAALPPPRWVGSADVLGRIVWLTGALVLTPSLALGAILPAAARLAVDVRSTAGRRVGLVYAAGTLGSIVGTLATGFILIDRLGSRPTVALAAALLSALAMIALGRPVARPASTLAAPGRAVTARSVALAARLAALAPVAMLVIFRDALVGPCVMESAYFCIQIESRPGPVEVRAMLLDRLLHSYGAPTDPTHVEYGYTRYFVDLARLRAEAKPGLRTLFVGGGGYTVPRYLEAVYADAAVDVIEIDPKVTRAAELYLGLRPDTRIRTFNEDARQFFIQRRTAGGYDLVFGDAFNDLSIPYQLVTREFATQVKLAMVPDGVYAANVIDIFPAGDFLRAYLATIGTVFRHVGIMLEPIPGASSPWGDGPVTGRVERATFVVLASDAPLPLASLAALPGAPGAVIEVDKFETLVGGGGIVLTDDYAPVDALTNRLFLSRHP